MQCKKCGGNLIIGDGVYVCESCGTKYSVANYYEDIDTYICYIESDHAGRRTKDSIIAQDLYQKLEATKIKSFYSRISVSDLSGELYKKACNAALANAKTVIIIGTSKENFESLVNHYESLYTGKIVIPVFSEMNPYDIPKNISAIQALDYNKIGSDIDLIKSILNALGRTSEADLLTVNNKHTGKKQKKLYWL
ncbi:MAG: TFIIB-type zinc ribbon-containing protein [Clostridiales bacterium]|nr:TFIIB-type zinc ribbon-containing protein [Clostridiales bacterium]MCC8152024.1 TFIIB-type zinc ribbon-containing protein [Lachnospiraceae bacterium]